MYHKWCSRGGGQTLKSEAEKAPLGSNDASASNCTAAGHPSLSKLGRGTVPKILSANQVRPHRIQYYLERRDQESDAKMVQVLHVYKQVETWREKNAPPPDLVVVLSYDEKPGIQAIQNTAPDLPPVPGKHAAIGRDHEYIRHGTLSLLAGIDHRPAVGRGSGTGVNDGGQRGDLGGEIRASPAMAGGGDGPPG